MTISIGKNNLLTALTVVDAGMMLDGQESGEILLPNRYVTNALKPGDEIDVFISFDSNDRIVATTEKPFAMAGEFALLDVISVSKIGAFLDWGMTKDLFLPFREQPDERVRVGGKALVHVYHDELSNRMVSSMKLSRFVSEVASPYAKEGDKVDLLIVGKTDLGYKAIVDGAYWGLLYENQIFHPLKRGERCQGYIQKIRSDGKIDLSLLESGYAKIDQQAEKILKMLQEAKSGMLPFNDKSTPDDISATFGISKKVFKQSIGNLYKQRLIVIEDRGIRRI